MRRIRDLKWRQVFNRGIVLRAVSGQTDDLLQLQDINGNVLGYISAAGAVYVSAGVIFKGMTTGQRDALAQQDRPTGTVIRNTDTGLLEQNLGTAAAPTWRYIGRLAIDINLAGTLASRPLANAVDPGVTYLATDDRGGTLYRSNGTAWVQAAVSVADSRLTDQRVPLDGSVTPPKIGAGTFNFDGLRQGGMDVQRTPQGPNRHIEMGQVLTTYGGFSTAAGGSAAFINPFAAAPRVVFSIATAPNAGPYSMGLSTVTATSMSLFSFGAGSPGFSQSFNFVAEGPD